MGYRDAIPRLEWTETLPDAVLVADATDLGLDANYVANGWVIQSSVAYPHPASWWGTDGAVPWLSGSVLFAWYDNDPATPPQQLGPSSRSTWIEKTLTGLVPGATYGLTFAINWTLDSGPGNIFLEIEGTSASRYSVLATGGTIWTVSTLQNDVLYRLRADATTAGEITIRLGGENYAPSANVLCTFTDAGVYRLEHVPRGLLFPYPPEDVRSFRRPLPGSQRLTLPSGETDAWTIGQSGRWTCEARWIPAVSSLALPDNDGWEDRDDSGTLRAGWDRFLRHAGRGGQFRFYPDSTDLTTYTECVWDEQTAPLPPALEDDLTRLEALAFRTIDGSLIAGYSQG